jgi:hypothetical protein
MSVKSNITRYQTIEEAKKKTLHTKQTVIVTVTRTTLKEMMKRNRKQTNTIDSSRSLKDT